MREAVLNIKTASIYFTEYTEGIMLYLELKNIT